MARKRRAVEFDCCECGRHIVLVVGDRPKPPLCAACMMLPGWFRDARLRALLDHEHSGHEACEEKGPAR